MGKNQVHAIRVMLSASPEAMERIQHEGRLDDWCEQSVKWMQDTFGIENLVSAVLHIDEQTTHIHATVVPIVTATRRKKKSEDSVKKHYCKKAEGSRLCADDIYRAILQGRESQRGYCSFGRAKGEGIRRFIKGKIRTETDHAEKGYQ
uniref:plasmid recombination protein n=1 Tax=Prevotella micans TaxID=189723 RepID=UPI00037A416B|nr:plasmid recombination protein [Prevotella micans]